MAVETPTINKIYKMTEFDLNRTSYTPGNMYICLDSYKLYYDETKNRRVTYDYESVSTVNDLRNNVTPVYGKTYYCWEDNSLWLWINKWVSLWSDSTYPSAYVYDGWSSGSISEVYRHDQPLLSADDNGLLHDGSVVVRDRNRIIKGRIYVDDGNDNFTISSYLGGGLRFLPNGLMNSDGEFLIDEREATVVDNETSEESTVTIPAAKLRAEFRTLNHEMVVDYTEQPELDNNPYQTEEHTYQVYHTGNLDASLIHEITPTEIYTKLQDTSLPAILNLSVSKLGGLDASSYSKVGHTHTASEITDFNTQAREQASIELKTIFNSATGNGITINFDTTTKALKLTANPFYISLVGGVSGYNQVVSLTDTTIDVTVDPDKHVHQNYIDTMDSLQRQINNIKSLDPNDYYTKTETDGVVQSLAGTTTPQSGHPLLVNSEGKLPGTATSADKLSTLINVYYTGDVTGTLTTDFNGDSTVVLSAENILSETPEPGKALMVNNDNILDVTVTEAKQLDHTVTFSLLGDVTGTAVWNTQDSLLQINTSIDQTTDTWNKLLLVEDIGTKVPGLEQDTNGNYKIGSAYIPDEYSNKLTFKDYFTPTTSKGVPSDTASDGDFYIIDTEGYIGEELYAVGDWAIYIDGKWIHLSTHSAILSVNGKTGIVEISADDETDTTLNAISKRLINYTIEPVLSDPDAEGNQDIIGYTEIPSGSIVKTTDTGVIRGASIEKLENLITISSDTSVSNATDIAIMTNSPNLSVDGSISNSDLILNMKITESGYQNIVDNTGYVITSNNSELEHRKYLNFTSDFKVEVTTDTYNISDTSDRIVYLWYKKTVDDSGNTIITDNESDVITTLQKWYIERGSNPILLVVDYLGRMYQFNIDSNSSDLVVPGTITLTSSKLLTQSVDDTTTLFEKYLILNIDTDAATQITDLIVQEENNEIGSYLSISHPGTSVAPTTFLPSEEWQPATKAYVDETISQGAQLSYFVQNLPTTSAGTTTTITHNLNTQNVFIQFRYISDGKQVFMENSIVDNNNISITSDSNISENTIKVIILALG